MEQKFKKLDCYWFILENKMKAICPECYKILKKGWFWKGSKLGYGDYELKCNSCNEIINKKGSNE